MAQTNIRGAQILNNTVQRQDLDTSTVGQSVVTKLVQGSNVSLSSTGADAGTGDVTISVPTVGVSIDSGNAAVLGSDSKIYVGDSGIASVISQRTRGYNAIGNQTLECTQRDVGNLQSNPAGGNFITDRWSVGKIASTIAINSQVVGSTVLIPGTNFRISRAALTLTLTAQQASLATGDYYLISQIIEGPYYRELVNDVHSISLLVNSSVAGLKFAVSLRDNPATQSLVSLCTISSANTWTLIPLPNLPVWPVGGGANFSAIPGSIGYQLSICLACGSTLTTSTLGSWVSGSFVGASGMSNFGASPVNSTFALAFVQHEPGNICTQLQDADWNTVYDRCLRYFCKSYDFETAPGTATAIGCLQIPQVATTGFGGYARFPKAMAKIPSVTIFNHATGGANSIRLAGTDYSVSSVSNIGKGGFAGLATATLPAVTLGAQSACQYFADTGW